MPVNLINRHILLLEQNVKTVLQCTKRREQMRAHKVRQAELIICMTDKQRTSLIKAGNALAGEVVIRKKSAAVRLAL